MAGINRLWQAALIETAMGRYKGIIGPCLGARSFAAQQTEAAIGVAILTDCSPADARNPFAVMHRSRQRNKRYIKDRIPHKR